MNTDTTNSYCPVLDYIDERAQVWSDRICKFEHGLRISENSVELPEMWLYDFEHCFFKLGNNNYDDFLKLIDDPIFNDPSILVREIENLLFSIQTERQIELYKKKLNRVMLCLNILSDSLEYTIKVGQLQIKAIELESVCPTDEQLRIKVERGAAMLTLANPAMIINEEWINSRIIYYKTFYKNCRFALKYLKKDGIKLARVLHFLKKINFTNYTVPSSQDVDIDEKIEETNAAANTINNLKEPSVPVLALMYHYIDVSGEWGRGDVSQRQELIKHVGPELGISGDYLYNMFTNFQNKTLRLKNKEYLQKAILLLEKYPKAQKIAIEELE